VRADEKLTAFLELGMGDSGPNASLAFVHAVTVPISPTNYGRGGGVGRGLGVR
jgi:hypothetical protein